MAGPSPANTASRHKACGQGEVRTDRDLFPRWQLAGKRQRQSTGRQLARVLRPEDQWPADHGGGAGVQSATAGEHGHHWVPGGNPQRTHHVQRSVVGLTNLANWVCVFPGLAFLAKVAEWLFLWKVWECDDNGQQIICRMGIGKQRRKRRGKKDRKTKAKSHTRNGTGKQRRKNRVGKQKKSQKTFTWRTDGGWWKEM